MQDNGSRWSSKSGAFIDSLIFGALLILILSLPHDNRKKLSFFLLVASGSCSVTGVLIAVRVRLWTTEKLPTGLILWAVHGITTLGFVATVKAIDEWRQGDFVSFVLTIVATLLLYGIVTIIAGERLASKKVAKGYDQFGSAVCLILPVVVTATVVLALLGPLAW
jgi:hypothetical protein